MIKREISYLRRAQGLGLALALIFLHVSCGGGSQAVQPVISNLMPAPECDPGSIPPPRSSFTVENGPITQLASEVGKDAGQVVASGHGSTNRTIFIFEEKHDSRTTQLEIALMLWRLQKSQEIGRAHV